jgi:hypothetical protein
VDLGRTPRRGHSEDRKSLFDSQVEEEEVVHPGMIDHAEEDPVAMIFVSAINQHLFPQDIKLPEKPHQLVTTIVYVILIWISWVCHIVPDISNKVNLGN